MTLGQLPSLCHHLPTSTAVGLHRERDNPAVVFAVVAPWDVERIGKEDYIFSLCWEEIKCLGMVADNANCGHFVAQEDSVSGS